MEKEMEERPACPNCHAKDVIKNGSTKGRKRWKCKECAYSFTKLNTQRGFSPTIKALAQVLYLSGLSFRAIGAIIQASHVSVLNWIKELGYESNERPNAEGAVFLELDEMWHFVGSKKRSYGSGRLMMVIEADLLTGRLETGIVKLFGISTSA